MDVDHEGFTTPTNCVGFQAFIIQSRAAAPTCFNAILKVSTHLFLVRREPVCPEGSLDRMGEVQLHLVSFQNPKESPTHTWSPLFDTWDSRLAPVKNPSPKKSSCSTPCWTQLEGYQNGLTPPRAPDSPRPRHSPGLGLPAFPSTAAATPGRRRFPASTSDPREGGVAFAPRHLPVRRVGNHQEASRVGGMFYQTKARLWGKKPQKGWE